MADQATRAAAIEAFADRLRELRAGSGNPSFRELAGRSRAISHTTLHEAAQGNRLPSWPTTVEFVKACGGDPDAYRERWQAADRVVSATDDDPVTPADPATPAAAAPAAARTGGSRPRWLPYAVAGGVVVVLAAAVLVVLGLTSGSDGGSSGGTATRYTAADCSVRQTDPPSAPPAHQGDAEVFVRDVSLTDCTHVVAGSTVKKVWRFRNIGTVTWRGYALHRIDLPQRRGDCQTIADVPVPTTLPGRTVDVAVSISTPTRATFCFVRFKMVDATGRTTFPASRPVNFQIIVDR
ncbi:Ig-like domain-containing protein [Jatrophihabitans endophyticus]|uniref:Ig-like domain-containing protein n=1 Tax=Jatrophihabitans endophyticus TaxID=1206085 RepID=A0A1M5GB70_9ACTN|nr:NBR1-Ig-like domain-containing protein [Jatrophihabitans endophyticus]SHG00964.1 Ig-like domain-containing protein [Jatrophihabitans endophyticus]